MNWHTISFWTDFMMMILGPVVIWDQIKALRSLPPHRSKRRQKVLIGAFIVLTVLSLLRILRVLPD